MRFLFFIFLSSICLVCFLPIICLFVLSSITLAHANRGHCSSQGLYGTCMRMLLFAVCTVDEFACKVGDIMQLYMHLISLCGIFFFSVILHVFLSPPISLKWMYFIDTNNMVLVGCRLRERTQIATSDNV